jgi:phosphate transport system protein
MQMGRLVRQTTAEALAALARRDADLARKQIERDRTIDVIHRRIETKAIETIARRQPVAVDLRELVGAVRIANDLERIGDLAKSICKRVLLMDAPVHPDLLQPITRVSTPAMRQLGLVLESYADRDSGQALSVWSSDKQIDAAHAALLRELLTHMVEDPRNIVVCAHLLFCSKNLERIGDHTTNIAESVHYLVTGQRLDGERPRGEDLSFWRAPSLDLPA